MMVRRLPPLNPLPSFEAAARLMSFSKAADELHVTHGAVSRAIRSLEDHLGVRLFERATRSVRLTAIGSAYAAEVRDVLDHLAVATLTATGQHASGALNVSALDGFVAKWLVPRLFRFRQAHGDIDLRLSTSDRLADFVSDGIDIAIRYGRGTYPGLKSDFLLEDDLYPVCSPDLLAADVPLREPADLKNHTLIHHDHYIDWSMWLMWAGVEGVNPHRGPAFRSTEHAVQAAMLGEGVVLGPGALVRDDVAAGRLVRPFDISFPAELAYYIVYPPRALQRQKVRLFHDWLLSEAARDDA